MRLSVLIMLGLITVGCKLPQSESASTQTLQASYGRKKIYLWNKKIKSPTDKIERSCWYYKEVSPSLGLSEAEAIQTSSRLNDFAIHDGHISKQMERLVKDKLTNVGAEFVPCGLATLSVAAAVGTGGASAVAFGISSAWMANNCIKNTINIERFAREFRGASDGLASFEGGETIVGRVFPASKGETDMFRESIRRARQLGLEDKVSCPRASELTNTKR